ncbi:hypothetical protein Thi970DRAFT_02312 [Thiorhodovibrio frisius]|uniref:Uncharacterized protein n=1 Tax=Thiorhodovibrio frisius TaxID=631362 RepID=H8YZE1_9GAMM|nr:hypothetical protein Thi970DRAFT_02312 [Thiorhodovibrio frisius]WPL24359.1 hypothetical protein Thiofri_04578 [Thiorhodovibrio frisius]
MVNEAPDNPDKDPRQGLEHYRARPRERNERGYWKLLECLHVPKPA